MLYDIYNGPSRTAVFPVVVISCLLLCTLVGVDGDSPIPILNAFPNDRCELANSRGTSTDCDSLVRAMVQNGPYNDVFKPTLAPGPSSHLTPDLNNITWTPGVRGNWTSNLTTAYIILTDDHTSIHNTLSNVLANSDGVMQCYVTSNKTHDPMSCSSMVDEYKSQHQYSVPQASALMIRVFALTPRFYQQDGTPCDFKPQEQMPPGCMDLSLSNITMLSTNTPASQTSYWNWLAPVLSVVALIACGVLSSVCARRHYKDKPLVESWKRKNHLDAWLYWLPPAGFFGCHHYYLGRPEFGLFYTMTLGGMMGLGWLVDLFRLPFLVESINHGDQPLVPGKWGKTKGDAYVLWLPPAGLIGLHHLYLGRPLFMVLYMLSFGLFGIGWLIDLFRIPTLFQRALAKQEQELKDATDPTQPLLSPYGTVDSTATWGSHRNGAPTTTRTAQPGLTQRGGGNWSEEPQTKASNASTRVDTVGGTGESSVPSGDSDQV